MQNGLKVENLGINDSADEITENIAWLYFWIDTKEASGEKAKRRRSLHSTENADVPQSLRGCLKKHFCSTSGLLNSRSLKKQDFVRLFAILVRLHVNS